MHAIPRSESFLRLLEFTIGQLIELLMYANTMFARRPGELYIAPGSPLQSKRSPGIYHAHSDPASKQARTRGKTQTLNMQSLNTIYGRREPRAP